MFFVNFFDHRLHDSIIFLLLGLKHVLVFCSDAGFFLIGLSFALGDLVVLGFCEVSEFLLFSL